jgi:thiamine biosynthesis lipoprotein
MANPCTVLVDTDDEAEAEELLGIAETEAHRVEQKFSRYRRDNVVYRINHSEGGPIDLDEETALLINYAATCHAMSDGMFDVTSGVLRRVWTFDGSSRVPARDAVRKYGSVCSTSGGIACNGKARP